MGGDKMSCKSDSCACTNVSCPLHGKCCECVARHRGRNEIPGCFFSKSGEKAYNRSIDFFIKDYTENLK